MYWAQGKAFRDQAAHQAEKLGRGHRERGSGFGCSGARAAFIVGGGVIAQDEMLDVQKRRHGFCLGMDTVPVWDKKKKKSQCSEKGAHFGEKEEQPYAGSQDSPGSDLSGRSLWPTPGQPFPARSGASEGNARRPPGPETEALQGGSVVSKLDPTPDSGPAQRGELAHGPEAARKEAGAARSPYPRPRAATLTAHLAAPSIAKPPLLGSWDQRFSNLSAHPPHVGAGGSLKPRSPGLNRQRSGFGRAGLSRLTSESTGGALKTIDLHTTQTD